MIETAAYWINQLNLEKHPEGGWYREVYRSEDVIPQTGLPAAFRGSRCFSTSIYYLLNKNEFSAFHRIKSDEVWHYYTGTSAVELLLLEQGHLKRLLLGNDPGQLQNLQVVVPKTTWFAARLLHPEGFALAGCTVAPGFHFEDFELADERLLMEFPEINADIRPFINFSSNNTI